MTPEESILDTRLAEIDRRLRSIQSGLAGEAACAEPAPPPPPADDVSALGQVVSELRDITAAHQRLLDSLREAMSSLADVLVRAERLRAGEPLGSAPGFGPAPPPPPLRAVPVPPRPASTPDPIGVAAGPFAGAEALRRFERTLSALPEVRMVAVREFVGADRAIVDVHLVD